MKKAEFRGPRARHRRVVTPRERLEALLRVPALRARRAGAADPVEPVEPAEAGTMVLEAGSLPTDGSRGGGGWTSALRRVRFRPSWGSLLRADQPRPAVVTVACALMALLTLLQLANAVLSLTVGVEVDAAIERDVGAEGQGDVNAAIGIVFGLVIAVAFMVLAVLNMRGSNGARIATWVLTAFWLFAGFCLVARTALFPAEGEIGRFKTWSITAAGLSVVLYLAIMVLLARPEAHAFFRPVVPDSEFDEADAPPVAETFFRSDPVDQGQSAPGRSDGAGAGRPTGAGAGRPGVPGAGRPDGGGVGRGDGPARGRPDGPGVNRPDGPSSGRPGRRSAEPPDVGGAGGQGGPGSDRPGWRSAEPPDVGGAGGQGGPGSDRPGWRSAVRPDGAGADRPGGPGVGRPGVPGVGRPDGTGIGRPVGPGVGRPGGTGMGRPDGTGMGRPDGTGMGRPVGPGAGRPGVPGGGQPGGAGAGRTGGAGAVPPPGAQPRSHATVRLSRLSATRPEGRDDDPGNATAR